MITTFQALAVALLALLPGATYSFTFEHFAGSYGSASADRVIRFFAASACFLAVYSAPAMWLYHRYVASGDLRRGEVSWLMVEAVSIGYIAIPAVVGGILGWSSAQKWTWTSWLFSSTREPRAWDFVWEGDKPSPKILRIKLKSGTWLAGIYAKTADNQRSYASGYPESGDLYLSQQLLVDPETGEYELGEDGEGVLRNAGLLIRWEEIEYLDILVVREAE